LILFDFINSSLYWLVAVAGLGLTAMAIFVLLVAAPKWGPITDLFRRTVIRAKTLRGRLLIGFFLIGAVPVLTLPPLLMLQGAGARQHELTDELRADASNLSHGVDRLVAKQVAAVDALAAHINSLEQLDDSTLGEWLLRHHKAHPEFVSTWVAGSDGEVIAATAFLDGDTRPWVGPLAGVSLLKFFPSAVADGGLYVSPVMKGVPPRHDPMMVISAPLFAENAEPWGFIQAQLNLRRVYRNVVSYDSIPGHPIFLTDQKNRIMAASPEVGFETFHDLSGQAVVTGMGEGLANTYGFEGVIEADGSTGHYLAVRRTLDNGWRVFAVAPLAGMRAQGLIFVGLSVIWVLIVAFLAVKLARLYGGIVTEPLQTLKDSLEVFDAEHTMKLVPMPPKDAPIEIANVFNRVRRSMEKSRDSYRNMLRAVNEGDRLRRKLKTDDHRKAPSMAAKDRPESKPPPAPIKADKRNTGQKKAAPEYLGSWDSITGLTGREGFKAFFNEAWLLGCTDTRPVSLLVFSIGIGDACPTAEPGSVDHDVLKVTGEVLIGMAGRPLDLAARFEADKYILVLPDTDLYGALIVAERAREALNVALTKFADDKALAANVGVASIVPTPAGDALSFVKMAQRALLSAQRKSGSQVAYADLQNRIKVLEEGEPLPSAPPVATEAVEDKMADDPAGSGSSTSDLVLSLEKTRQAAAAKQVVNSDVAPGHEDTNRAIRLDQHDPDLIDWDP